MVTEILLRKTNAEKVQNYIGEVEIALPSPQAVLAICDAKLYDLLQPFGLQQRKAAELRVIASILVERHGGLVPGDLHHLQSLPGVGDYISNAVMCFAFGSKHAVLDTNVIRIFDRALGVQSVRSRPRTDPILWRLAHVLLPKRLFKEYNWALLDLGKRVCKAQRPSCYCCPLADLCVYRSDTNDMSADQKSATLG